MAAQLLPGTLAGFDEFWSKPIDIRRLKRQLHHRQRQLASPAAPMQRDFDNPAMV